MKKYNNFMNFRYSRKSLFGLSLIIFIFFLFKSYFGASAVQCPVETQKAYKTPGLPGVYYVTDECTKRSFTNKNIYFTYFRSWNEVSLVSKNIIDSIPLDKINFMPYGPLYNPKYGALVKIVNDPKVYLLLGTEKYWITSEEVFNKLNYFWGWIEDVDIRLLDKYTTKNEINYTDHHPNYTLVKYPNSPEVYRLEPDPNDGSRQFKRHIKNETEFNSLGFRWDRIVTVDLSETYLDESQVGKVETESEIPSAGCSYNNPACGSDYICINNSCVLKNGCQYNNPRCLINQECLNNQCVKKAVEGPITFSWLGVGNSCGDSICANGENSSCPTDCNLDNKFAVLREGQLSSMAPNGYEAIAKANLKDLKYCMPLVSNFLGITPYYDNVFLQTYIAETNLGYSNSKGVFYRRTQANIDRDLRELVEDSADGFLYKSGPTYCANTHELTHVFTGHLKYFSGWMTEGISEYAQKNLQSGSKDGTECRDNGVYRRDDWGDMTYKVFPYKPLGSNYDRSVYSDGPIWYATGMCFWEYIDKTYGREKFREIFKHFNNINDINKKYESDKASKDFIFENVLKPVLGVQIEAEVRARFGIVD